MKNFGTGHDVFDSLIDIKMGSLITIMDETYTESISFIEALLSYQKRLPVYIILTKEFDTPFQSVKLELTSLNEINLEVARFRDSIRDGYIIHWYLPNILLMENEDIVLRMLEHWSHQIANRNIVEFYLLPKGAFQSFEKKLQALTDGVITLSVKKGEKSYESIFSILRGAKPEFHLKEFLYNIQDKRLLIKWPDTYTDQLPKKDAEALGAVKQFIIDNMNSLKISSRLPPYTLESRNATLYDKLLFSQIMGKNLSEVLVLFPDRFEEILEKLAIWKVDGIATLDPAEKTVLKPESEKRPSLKNRVALALPTKVALAFLKTLYRKKKMRVVPLDSYMAIKKSADAFCQILMPNNKEATNHFDEIESFFHDLATRITALEYMKMFEETSQVKLDPGNIPKFCSITLYQAYGLTPKIEATEENIFEITLDNCIFCKGITSSEPVCNMVSTSLTGVLSVIYKGKFSCHEVECKAMGNENCKFILKRH